MYETMISVKNEWDPLREVFVGVISNDFMVPEHVSEFKWMGVTHEHQSKDFGGILDAVAFEKALEEAYDQVETLCEVFRQSGVTVHRNTLPGSETAGLAVDSFQFPEEKHFLDHIQKGLVISGGADFFRVIGETVILLNNLRYPFRRKQIYSVRPPLETLIWNSNAKYIALPPATPYFDRFDKEKNNDIYLENGDIMIDGENIYVGLSGNATSDNGVKWLEQNFGEAYRIHKIKLPDTVLHLDTVLTLNKEGVLTYYHDLIDELPEPLQSHWHHIRLSREKEQEAAREMGIPDLPAFGANNLTIDPETIVVSAEFDAIHGLEREYRNHGFKNIINIPMLKSIMYGSGSRCLTGVLHRSE